MGAFDDADTIIKELWQVKDAIALEQGYDIDELVAYLQGKEWSSDRQVLDLRARREVADQGTSMDSSKIDR